MSRVHTMLPTEAMSKYILCEKMFIVTKSSRSYFEERKLFCSQNYDDRAKIGGLV